MPPRIAVAGIVVFWLAVTGFAFYRDTWPRLFALGPPPVAVELADEARQSVPARWIVQRNGKPIGTLVTHMKYHDAEDAFQFTYKYKELTLKQGSVSLIVPEATSDVRITRAGELKQQTMTAKLRVTLGELEIAQGTIDIRGAVRNGTLTGHAALKSNVNLLNLEDDLEPVAVPRTGQPLNPLQPVHRLAHIHGGKTWIVDESNPLQDAVTNLLKKKFPLPLPDEKKKPSLVARVNDAPQVLTWQKEAVPCWVIEYRRTDVIARTWVRVSDGKVLKQEAFEKGEVLSFERED